MKLISLQQFLIDAVFDCQFRPASERITALGAVAFNEKGNMVPMAKRIPKRHGSDDVRKKREEIVLLIACAY